MPLVDTQPVAGQDIPVALAGKKTVCASQAVVFVFLVALILPGCGFESREEVEKVNVEPLAIEIAPSDVKALLDDQADFFLLDCRETEEHARASIAAATLLPMSEIQQRVGELEPQKERHIVVHCHLGGRSLQVAQWLREQGYSQAQSMAGGIAAWSEEIDPSVPTY